MTGRRPPKWAQSARGAEGRPGGGGGRAALLDLEMCLVQPLSVPAGGGSAVESWHLGGRRAGRVKVRGHLLAKTAQQTRKGADLEREIRLRN